MAERLAQTKVPSIRFHHLRHWWEILNEYEKKFGHVKPWDLQVSVRDDFISDFAHEDSNGDMVVRRYFEECSSAGQEFSQHDLAYLYDLVGSTQEQFDQVLNKRITAYKRIFDAVSADKDVAIVLTTEPDDYCLSCAVGKHCDRDLLEKILRSDKDFAYMGVLRKLMKRDLKKYASDGVIGELGKDKMFIQGKLLFDPYFHQSILAEVLKTYKEAWMV